MRSNKNAEELLETAREFRTVKVFTNNSKISYILLIRHRHFYFVVVLP